VNHIWNLNEMGIQTRKQLSMCVLIKQNSQVYGFIVESRVCLIMKGQLRD